ncbi:PIN domain-containing protein [Roseibium sp.]|uniref:PIN domain-containing protein n=1 Tax=Roseibium sp. TaxID=1936156 RepID=UPI002613455D|nr:PIN domain-containing protein [Roseibium sp.]
MPTDFVADGFCVVLDANVIYPNRMRDILLTLVHHGLFRAVWTDEIMEEWSRNVLANHATTQDKIDRTIAIMKSAFEANWIDHHRPLIEGIEGLPDADDRHVVAAAIAANAQQIVTNNIKDFPADVLEEHELEAIDPDTFLVGQFELNPPLAIKAVRTVRQRYGNPSMTRSEFLTDLTAKGMPKFAARLRPNFENI